MLASQPRVRISSAGPPVLLDFVGVGFHILEALVCPSGVVRTMRGVSVLRGLWMPFGSVDGIEGPAQVLTLQFEAPDESACLSGAGA